MTPDPAAAARFAADLAACLPGSPASRVGLAVSGGPDSMAMLLLAHAALPGRTAAATVDHGLRRDSGDEAAMVAAVCADLAVPHAILTPERPIAGASLQARAREARYAALARWAEGAKIDAVATAHHADDQAETFLMRAARGSGLAGLAGIRPRQAIAGARIVRPLLGWRRAELRAIVRRALCPFVDDPANLDPRHDRARFRRLLEANEWLDPPALARAAGHLAEADADLAAVADWLWDARRTEGDGAIVLEAAALPRDLQRRLVRRAIGAVRAAAAIRTPAWSDAANVESLLDALRAGRRATQAGVLASAARGLWRLRPAPPRRALRSPI